MPARLLIAFGLGLGLAACRWDFERGDDPGVVIGRDAPVADDGGALGGTITIEEVNVGDTEIHAQMPDQRYGTGLLLSADASPEERILIKFDLSAVPPGATIDAASLELYVADDNPALLVTVHEVLEDWDEAAASWNERLAGVSWSAPGGAFAELQPISFAPRGHTVMTVDLTPVAQGWVERGAPNYGIILLIGATSGQVNVPSRESGSYPGPTLTVAYR